MVRLCMHAHITPEIANLVSLYMQQLLLHWKNLYVNLISNNTQGRLVLLNFPSKNIHSPPPGKHITGHWRYIAPRGVRSPVTIAEGQYTSPKLLYGLESGHHQRWICRPLFLPMPVWPLWHEVQLVLSSLVGWLVVRGCGGGGNLSSPPPKGNRGRDGGRGTTNGKEGGNMWSILRYLYVS